MTTTITLPRSVVEQALEAFEDHAKQYPHMQKGYTVDAANALRAALEQPQVEQEPVAWMHTNAAGDRYFRKKPHDKVFNPQPVYTHPQPKREPLTDEAEHQCPYPKANPSTRNAWLDGWEAAERAHGIGGDE